MRKSHLNLAFEQTSSVKIYLSSTAALTATLATQYLIPGRHLIELVLGTVTFSLVYLGALKITHTLSKPDFDMIHPQSHQPTIQTPREAANHLRKTIKLTRASVCTREYT